MSDQIRPHNIASARREVLLAARSPSTYSFAQDICSNTKRNGSTSPPASTRQSVLEEFKLLIGPMYKIGFPVEEIVESLCLLGAQVSIFQVHEILQNSGIIPSLSIAGNDEPESTGDGLQKARSDDSCSMCCLNGETAHISHSNLASIPFEATQLNKYLQDHQCHEAFACGSQFRFLEHRKLSPPFERNSDSDSDSLLSHYLKFRNRSRLSGHGPLQAPNPRIRRQGVIRHKAIQETIERPEENREEEKMKEPKQSTCFSEIPEWPSEFDNTEDAARILEVGTDWKEDRGSKGSTYHDISRWNNGMRPKSPLRKQSMLKGTIKEPFDRHISMIGPLVGSVETQIPTCHGDDASSPKGTTGVSAASNNTSSSANNLKRNLNGGDDGHKENRGNLPPKRPKCQPKSREIRPSVMKFACPYHQHDPLKYGVNMYSGDADYRSCAGPGWKSVARMKEHLYRRHRAPIQCSRCNETFKHQDYLNAHSREAVPCEIQPEDPMEGITLEIEKRLKSRKKAYPKQSEEDRWREVYQILFPNEEIPSPYYEYEDDLAEYEEYSRRETPRVLLELLEGRSSTCQIGDLIKNDLVDIIQECRRYIYRKYRRQTLQSTLTAQDATEQPSSVPIPLLSDDNHVELMKIMPEATSQASINHSLDFDPEDFRRLFQHDDDYATTSQKQCYCLESCSCPPSSVKNFSWMP